MKKLNSKKLTKLTNQIGQNDFLAKIMQIDESFCEHWSLLQ